MSPNTKEAPTAAQTAGIPLPSGDLPFGVRELVAAVNRARSGQVIAGNVATYRTDNGKRRAVIKQELKPLPVRDVNQPRALHSAEYAEIQPRFGESLSDA
ncbi:hypothetical protein LRD69_28425 [Streptomyces sp. JH14]|uniref:hypothetical protein n=1 Tax=Streptomyces sp. JH14 TaxID=2793630 RepID=UPI0023F8D0C4|nr:hypothetical protein [Streptomyces sp. JH14]MDF6045989.1 hypothetical protein [Streptomyces sp. JH14]